MTKVLVLGGSGMVGSALIRRLEIEKDTYVFAPTSSDLDLTVQADVNSFFQINTFDQVYFVAAKVGGIKANKENPADFGYLNGIMTLNVLEAAKNSNVKKLLFLGSSCIYPKGIDEPISEDRLLSGFLEPTNEMYALAKIYGVKLCDAYRKQYGCNFISAMPCNLYGPNDNFDPSSSHVIPGLIRKFEDAKEGNLESVQCWGDGTPRREFLHVCDCAEACIFLMKNYAEYGHINVGVGEDISIKELAEGIKNFVGYTGNIVWQTDAPNGTMRKVLDVSKINSLGWKATISFRVGLLSTYKWFKENCDD